MIAHLSQWLGLAVLPVSCLPLWFPCVSVQVWPAGSMLCLLHAPVAHPCTLQLYLPLAPQT